MPYKDPEKNKECARRGYRTRRRRKTCRICGTIFRARKSQKNCATHFRNRPKKVRRCVICGVQITQKNRKNCSATCRAESFRRKRVRVEVACTTCGAQMERCRSLMRKRNFCSIACRNADRLGKPNKKIRGKNHPGWKGGKRKRKTSSLKYKKWRRGVLFRDHFACQQCGRVGGRLVAHHIKYWSTHPKLRFVLTNGMTLCANPCHRDVHGGNFFGNGKEKNVRSTRQDVADKR